MGSPGCERQAGDICVLPMCIFFSMYLKIIGGVLGRCCYFF